MNKNTREVWDSRLERSRKHPWPLAPNDWIRAGAPGGNKKYRRENRNLGKSCDDKMRQQLLELKDKNPNGGIIVVFGIGIPRDLGWVESAIKMGFAVMMLDISLVACKNARRIFKNHDAAKILPLDVVEALKTGRIDINGIVAIYAAQFLEHQGEALPELLQHLGKFVQIPGRKVYLVLARLEDNPPKKVRFNSAVPLKDEEWQVPLMREFGVTIKEVPEKPLYFDRTFTFVVVSGKT